MGACPHQVLRHPHRHRVVRWYRPDAAPDDWALRHVSVTVEPGQTLALVGATGSGKSVLAALFSRLYDVTEGASDRDRQSSLGAF